MNSTETHTHIYIYMYMLSLTIQLVSELQAFPTQLGATNFSRIANTCGFFICKVEMQRMLAYQSPISAGVQLPGPYSGQLPWPSLGRSPMYALAMVQQAFLILIQHYPTPLGIPISCKKPYLLQLVGARADSFSLKGAGWDLWYYGLGGEWKQAWAYY